MENDITPQLHMNPEPGPRLQMKEMVELVTWPNETPKQAREAVHHLVRTRLVENRGTIGNGPNARNIFALADVAVAKALRTLTFMGISGEALQKASEALYSWHDTRDATFYHPITKALTDSAYVHADAKKAKAMGKSANWLMQIDCQLSEAGRSFTSAIYPVDEPLLSTAPHVGMVVVPLEPILTPLAVLLRQHVASLGATKH
jgi:hypothetical protein